MTDRIQELRAEQKKRKRWWWNTYFRSNRWNDAEHTLSEALDGWERAEADRDGAFERLGQLRLEHERLREAAREFLDSWNAATQPSDPDEGRERAAVRNLDAAVALRAELEARDDR